MNELMDRVLADWLDEGPVRGPRDGLERALAATRSVGQRPGWTLPERWIPMELAMVRTRSQRPILTLVMLALLMVALVVAALVIGSQRRQSSPPFRNGAVVYAQDGDLFIADQLGGTPRTLVAGAERDSKPIFSDHGDRIAYVREGTVGSRIMAVNPDGSNVTELATVGGFVLDSPRWAPDGSALLASYMGQEDWKQTDLIASDGTGSRTLDVGGHVISAVWRPGGRQILFLGLLDGGAHDADVSRGFYIADADGTNVRQLPVGGLEWSPDGKRISFVTEDAHGINQINIADIDEAGTMTGSRRLKLDPESSDEYGPQWSPDGSQLAFELGKGNREYVGVVDSDGSGFRILVPEGSALAGQSFTWSPDGRSLVFVQAPFFDPDGNLDHRGKVWSVDVATGEQTEVQTPVESWQRLAP